VVIAVYRLYGATLMTDLGAYKEDVKFAWGEASKLKHEFERAADELEEQVPRRRKLAGHAEHDWHGRYVSVFRRQHMSCTTEDARAIAVELRRCAKMLEQLGNLARQENKRRAVARDWEARHLEWERSHQGGLIGFIKDLDGNEEPEPPNVPEIIPQPFVATSPPCGSRD
jgi:hypothetical protein